MKLPICILLSCFASLQLRSQTYNYIPLIDSGIVWNGYSEVGGMGNSWPNRWSFYLSGETVIRNMSYQTISSAQGTVGYIREDSAKRVFYISKTPLNLEKPIYDFSLNVGDTLFWDSNFVSIKSVDTLTYFGKQRRKLFAEYSWLYNGHPWQEVWIEGIGSTYIPLTIWGTDSRYNSNTNNIRVCNVMLDNEIQYQTSTGWCNVNEISKLFSEQSITLFPNPASLFITFDLTNCKPPFVFQVYNLVGELQLEEKERNVSKQYTLPVSQFSSGIYFLKIYGDKGETQTIKFVKQD